MEQEFTHQGPGTSVELPEVVVGEIGADGLMPVSIDEYVEVRTKKGDLQSLLEEVGEAGKWVAMRHGHGLLRVRETVGCRTGVGSDHAAHITVDR